MSDGGVGLFEEEPFFLLFRHPGERPPAAHLEAEKLDLKLSLGELLEEVPLFHRPIPAAIPHDDRACAVVVRGNHSLEIGILYGVVLHMNREALLLRPDRRALRDRPALQHPIDLEPQIVMGMPGRVLLDHEQGTASPPAPAEWLRRPLRVALLPVRFKWGGSLFAQGLDPRSLEYHKGL